MIERQEELGNVKCQDTGQEILNLFSINKMS